MVPALRRPAHAGRKIVLAAALTIGLGGALAVALGAPALAGPRARHPAVAGEWPMYGHDLQRTNYNPDETVIGPGSVFALVPRWQAGVGTNGNPGASGAVVAGGQVFVGSSADTGPDFFAFDALTGSVNWSRSLTYTNGCTNIGIGSTAAVSGTTVVVGGGDAAYYGLDTATGAVRWREPLDVGPSGFAWESPLLALGRAYLGVASDCDNPSVRGEIRAVDALTGAPRGSAYFVGPGERGGGIWHSPALSPDGTTLAVTTGEDFSCSVCTYTRAMVSLDAQTLAIEQADQEGSPQIDDDFGTSPLIFHDHLGRTLVAAIHKNGTLYAYDLAAVGAGPVWSRAVGVTVGMPAAYDPDYGDGGTLVVNAEGWLYELDPATGADRLPRVGTGATEYQNLALANGLIFLNTGSGGLQIWDLASGVLLRTLMPAHAGDTYTGVAVANGFVYWVSGQYLNAWSLPAGTPTPTPTGTPPTPTPTGTATATATPSAPTATPTLPAPTATATASSATPTPTTPPSATASPTATPRPPSATPAPPTATATRPAPTSTATTLPATPTRTATAAATATPTACAISYADVHPTDYFYAPVLYLSCKGAIAGYADGTFRPYAGATRAQMLKIAVLGLDTPLQTPAPGAYTFADVPPGAPFFPYVETGAAAGIVGGYPCGGPGEPCDAARRNYFRPNAAVTRGQLAKLVTLAAGWAPVNPVQATFADVPPGAPFYTVVETAACRGVVSGYSCGGPGEPCDATHRPYFRPGGGATRGQIAKIVALAAARPGGCAPPAP